MQSVGRYLAFNKIAASQFDTLSPFGNESKYRRIKNQLDATYYFIVLLIGSTCFGHYYAHRQEL